MHMIYIVENCSHLPSILDRSIYLAPQLGGPFSSSGALYSLPIGATNTCQCIVGGKIVGPIFDNCLYSVLCIITWCEKKNCNWYITHVTTMAFVCIVYV